MKPGDNARRGGNDFFCRFVTHGLPYQSRPLGKLLNPQEVLLQVEHLGEVRVEFLHALECGELGQLCQKVLLADRFQRILDVATA